MPAKPPSGVIHDIGYQRYEGPRLGRRFAVLALFEHGLRTAFGLGRSGKAKIFPWLVGGLVGGVAFLLTAMRVQTGESPVSYAEFPEILTLLIILSCGVIAPELVSRDLRNGSLPLYFSRPLRRPDYALAKLAALITAVWLPLAVGQLVMFLGAAFSAPNLDTVGSEFGDFVLAVVYSAVHAVVFASIAILVASLASRRAVAAAAVVATFLVTSPIVGVLSIAGSRTVDQLAGLVSPVTLVGGIGQWLFDTGGPDKQIGDFGPLYGLVGVALVAVCVLLLLARYRKVAQ